MSGVAFADGLPPNNVGNFNNFDLEDFPTAPGQSQPVTPWVDVTPEYFRVLGLTLLEGRLLDERDALRENLESVMVDRAWARRFFPNGSAVGKRFREGGCTTCPWTTVVGRRQRSEVRRPRQAGSGNGVYANGRWTASATSCCGPRSIR